MKFPRYAIRLLVLMAVINACLLVATCADPTSGPPADKGKPPDNAAGGGGGNGRGRGGGGGTPPPESTTVVAPTCQWVDVSAAIGHAQAGWKVRIPPGECTWDKQLLISKDIVLEGAGITGAVATPTILRDAMPTNSALIVWSCPIGGNQRMTGIELRDGGRPTIMREGVVRIDCTNTASTTFRLDHNRFNLLNGVAVRPNTVVGVIDHNDFITTAQRFALYIYDPNWNGLDDRWGDSSWAAPVTWGSGDFLFVEDNTFTTQSCVDGYRGTRAVFRYNTFTDCHITVHGTESSGRNRGARAVEIYNNTFIGSTDPDAIMANIRSGSALIYSNTGINLREPAKSATFNQDRMTHSFQPFGGADGYNAWDVNRGLAEGPVVVSTVGTLNITALNSVPWTVDQWRGYTIAKVSAVAPCAEPNCYAVIQSNTANTITYSNSNGFGTPLKFLVGELFEIRKVTYPLDGIGRGQGALVSGGNATTAPPLPEFWNNQVTFPLRAWDNRNNGTLIPYGLDASCVGTCVPGVTVLDTPPPGYVRYTYPHPLVK